MTLYNNFLFKIIFFKFCVSAVVNLKNSTSISINKKYLYQSFKLKKIELKKCLSSYKCEFNENLPYIASTSINREINSEYKKDSKIKVTSINYKNDEIYCYCNFYNKFNKNNKTELEICKSCFHNLEILITYLDLVYVNSLNYLIPLTSIVNNKFYYYGNDLNKTEGYYLSDLNSTIFTEDYDTSEFNKNFFENISQKDLHLVLFTKEFGFSFLNLNNGVLKPYNEINKDDLCFVLRDITETCFFPESISKNHFLFNLKEYKDAAKNANPDGSILVKSPGKNNKLFFLDKTKRFVFLTTEKIKNEEKRETLKFVNEKLKMDLVLYQELKNSGDDDFEREYERNFEEESKKKIENKIEKKIEEKIEKEEHSFNNKNLKSIKEFLNKKIEFFLEYSKKYINIEESSEENSKIISKISEIYEEVKKDIKECENIDVLLTYLNEKELDNKKNDVLINNSIKEIDNKEIFIKNLKNYTIYELKKLNNLYLNNSYIENFDTIIKKIRNNVNRKKIIVGGLAFVIFFYFLILY